MSEQHRTFMAQIVDRPFNSAWIGIASPDNITGEKNSGTMRRGGRLVLFENEPISQAFVWMPEKDSWTPELWVAPLVENYRSLYGRFVKKYWPGGDLGEVGNNVDHVFPKDSAKLGGLSHVRLMAIPERPNVSAGTHEKRMKARNVLYGPRRKQTRLATLYSLGKAAGYVGYSGLQTLDGRRRIAAGLIQALRETGVSEEVTDSSLDEELLVETLETLR